MLEHKPTVSLKTPDNTIIDYNLTNMESENIILYNLGCFGI